MIRFTSRAVEILERADGAARRFNPAARIRLRSEGSGVGFELADEPAAGDATLDHPSGFSLWIEAGLEGTVDVEEPHDRLVLLRQNGTG